MPTLEATAEVTGTEIMHFGDWFMGVRQLSERLRLR